MVCDKCDGPPDTVLCPHFAHGRDKHRDAWQHYKKPPPSASVEKATAVRVGRVTPMPGDGNCLFHALAHNVRDKLGLNVNHASVRAAVSMLISRSPDQLINGEPIRSWVEWDSAHTPEVYATRMAKPGAWGGGIEIAIVAAIFKARVRVWAPTGMQDRYAHIADFGDDEQIFDVVYVGRAHYNAIRILDDAHGS